MSLSQEQIIEAISAMTVLDVAELVKKMEEKFGVSAAAPVAVAAVTLSHAGDIGVRFAAVAADCSLPDGSRFVKPPAPLPGHLQMPHADVQS